MRIPSSCASFAHYFVKLQHTTKETVGRRAPAAAHTAKGRLPLGTLRQSDGLSHSHIRVIPRADRETTHNNDEVHNDRTPTFRSPSLQFPSPFDPQTRSAEGFTSEPFSQAKTFADMARRVHQRGDAVESEQSAFSPVSLAGIIKLQPNRKKVSGPWRPMRPGDLGEYDNAGCNAKHVSSTTESLRSSGTFAASPTESACLPSIMPTNASSIPKHQGVLASQTNIFGTSTGISQARGNENDSNVLQSYAGDQCEQLFGKLPDPIRLHEEMGEFDGQVRFIGHPNRDVSAHQWSSRSFQWVNIGRYAHFRGKVEGSLASDRLKEYGASHNPLNFFKYAAKNREKIIVESGRPKEIPAGVHLPAPVDVVGMESLPTATSLASEGLPVFAHGSKPSSLLPFEEAKPVTPKKLHATVKGQCLEDPFVAPIRPPSSKISSGFQSRSDKKDSKGSLDFKYVFPFRSNTSAVLGLDCAVGSTSQEFISDGEMDHHKTSCGNTTEDRLSQPALRNVDFGEEAASGPVTTARSGFQPRKTPLPSSPEDIRDRRMLRNRLAELGDQTIRPGAQEHGRVATPNYAYLQPTARSLFPPPGLTVANPHRIVSRLNASASLYNNLEGPAPRSEGSGSEATTVNATAIALKFSDPDGLRQTQEHEIANGLGQQAPTMQCFKGPFFTDSKPTTSDPTVSLSVRIGEEEKLLNWFRDGHRPSRQQEYAKTLISAAAPSSRSRSFGVIGEASETERSMSYENTPPFVRLYEGLSEYIEEYRHGSGRSYFTRAWKAAPPQLRDSGPDGNNSYFHRPADLLPDSKARRSAVDLEAFSHAWGETVSVGIPTRARLPHDYLQDGGAVE